MDFARSHVPSLILKTKEEREFVVQSVAIIMILKNGESWDEEEESRHRQSDSSPAPLITDSSTPTIAQDNYSNADEAAIFSSVKRIAASNDPTTLIQHMHNLVDALSEPEEGTPRLKQKQEFFKRADGPRAVVSAMTRNVGCEQLQQVSIRILVDAMVGNDDMKAVTATVGGIYAVVDTMNNYDSSIDIQRIGLKFLGNITSDSRNAHLLIPHSNGVQCITKAMKRFSNDKDIIDFGKQTLWNLAYVSAWSPFYMSFWGVKAALGFFNSSAD